MMMVGSESAIHTHVQSPAKQRALGCVIPPLAAGACSRNLDPFISRSSVGILMN